MLPNAVLQIKNVVTQKANDHASNAAKAVANATITNLHITFVIHAAIMMVITNCAKMTKRVSYLHRVVTPTNPTINTNAVVNQAAKVLNKIF